MRERAGLIEATGRWIRQGDRIEVLADEPSVGAGVVTEEESTYWALSPGDVVDSRIDPCAQFSLLRLNKADPTGRAVAQGLVSAVRSGRVAGIYGENLAASAKLAAKLKTVWWKLIPAGEDAALVVDPNAPLTAPATIVFRSTQTTSSKPGEPQRCLEKTRLDAALRRVWASLQLLQSGELVRCAQLPSHSAELEAPTSTPVPNIVPAFCRRGEFTNVAGVTVAAPWADLMSFRPSTAIQKALLARGCSLQRIETGSGRVNLDLYTVRVDRLPLVGGSRATSEQLLRYIRLNLNTFAATSFGLFNYAWAAKFKPWDPAIDTPVWISPTPLGALVDIDMFGPDDGAVVVARHAPAHWIFSTVTAPTIAGPGVHPVSGNRMFGFRTTDDGLQFFIQGVDRTSGLTVPEWIAFGVGDALWRTVQDNVAKFINANGGSATVEPPFTDQQPWTPVRIIYFSPTVPVATP